MEKITVADLPALFEEISHVMQQNKELLTSMDANMGDGDLGLTMTKGFGALPAATKELQETDIGKFLVKTGWDLAAKIPSTMGTLMASGLVESGKALFGKEELGASDFVLFFEAFGKGIEKRGKCKPGDRTVLDAIDGAACAARNQISKDPSTALPELLQEAYCGAEQGMKKTSEMLPKFGKAAVFQNKALGVIDQGAMAGKLFVEGIRNFCAQ